MWFHGVRTEVDIYLLEFTALYLGSMPVNVGVVP